jgi:uncharacterized protein YycO
MAKLYMPGDVLFFTSGSGTDVADKVIEAVTGSNIVHCAIAVSAFFKVEALFSGVVKTPINYSTVAYNYYLHESANPLVLANITQALKWLDTQVGQMYGYGDVVNALLSKVETGVSIDVGEHYDCSGLATEFLDKCSGTQATTLMNAHNVTPVQLARTLGVVK